MAGVGVGFSPECMAQKKSKAGFPQGSADMQGQECGQGPSGGEVGAAGTLRVYFSKVLAVEVGLLVTLHTLPQGQGWANPRKCQSYLAQILQ